MALPQLVRPEEGAAADLPDPGVLDHAVAPGDARRLPAKPDLLDCACPEGIHTPIGK